MYQRLLAGRVMVPPKDTSIHQFTWADLTSLVYEQMCNLVTSSQRTDEKVSRILHKMSHIPVYLMSGTLIQSYKCTSNLLDISQNISYTGISDVWYTDSVM